MLCLGLTHLGTFGMGQAVAPWLALYFVYAYQLPLGPAAMLGSIGLLAGMLFRPLGGVLVARRVFSAIALMRVGTLLTCLALGILALPMHVLPLVGIGIALLSFGTTLPYAAVFNEAGRIGKLTGLGTGTAQGVVSLLSTPASSLGPPLIGLLVVQEGGTSSFSVAFGVLALVVLLTISTALLAGPALAHVTARSGRPRNTNTQQNRPFVAEKTVQVPQDRNRNTQLEAALLHLQGRTQQLLPGTLPLIATFGSLANTGFGERAVYTADATTIEHLLEAGGLPLLLPTPLSQEGTLDVPVEKQGFQHTFDQLIWPFFCQLLAQQIRGICFSENLDLHGEHGDAHTVPFDGKAFTQVETQQESKRLLRSIALLAWLIGVPILEGGQEIQSLQTKGRRTDSGRFRPAVNYDVDLSSTPWHEANDTGYSAFIAACAAYTPPALEALQPFRRELCDWLSQREQALLHQMPLLQGSSNTRTVPREHPAPRSMASDSWAAARLRTRQQKLRDIRGRRKTSVPWQPAFGAM